MLLPSLITLLSSTAVAAESHFEGIAAPTEERIEDSKFDIAFGGMWSAGNTDSATLSASYEGHRRWDQNQMSSKGGVTFGSAVADTDGDGRLSEEEKATGRVETASRKEAWLRYDRHLGDRDSFYSLAGGYADVYAGYDSRVNAQFGYSYRFLDAPETKGPALTGELGFDAAREEAVESIDTVEMVYSARALVRFALDLEDGVALGRHRTRGQGRQIGQTHDGVERARGVGVHIVDAGDAVQTARADQNLVLGPEGHQARESD